MADPKPRKRVSAKYMRSLSPAQRKKRDLKIRARGRAKKRAKWTAAEKSERRRADSDRCYDLERLMRQVRIEPDTGCWIWTGSYKAVYDDVRPVIRAGMMGEAYADTVSYCLHHRGGRRLGIGCYLERTCGRQECLAPTHIYLTNQLVERAKERLQNGMEERPRSTGS